jgi:hemoglobin/transferrin/lactoferrin receptor protein
MPQEELGKPAIYATNAEGNLYSPSWIIFSLNGQFQLSPRISLVGGIENIGDLQYRPYSSGLVSPGRNFQLTLKGNF